MLTVAGAVVRYGPVAALNGVDLTINAGERLAVLGPSGSGKTTLLRAVAGLEPLAAGSISWGGRELTGVPPQRRGFGLMFQEYVLFPHRDVAGNVGFGLRMRGDDGDTIARRVEEVLEMVGLRGYGKRRISELSGGEQQRVALARALAPSPRLLMLDEPLGALDRGLRLRLTEELDELFRSLELTILYVTHDQEEALSIGQQVAVMRDGVIDTLQPAEELWRRPATEFAARFLGMPNIVDAQIAAGEATTPWGRLPAPDATEGRWRLLLRPEGLEPAPDGPICGVVEARLFRGQRVLLRLAVAGAPPLVVHADWVSVPAIGERLCLRPRPGALAVLT
ncbi:MAG TPA: ABC transporter ATP-binding protein [Candidatus Limnocylindrales bacterium]|nr:ABC transporter ATP-binding protein [Candidatus Limnocylindrales bacterium]HWH72716.1 ABC transporter ATP-binding protein [Methylibium sp.]